MKNIKLLGIISLLSFSFSKAQPLAVINAGESKTIGQSVEFFMDSTNKIGVDEAIKHAYVKGQTDVLNLGNYPNNVWIRFAVNSKTERELFMQIDAPLLAQLELYKIENGKPVKIFLGGFKNPFHDRPIASENWLFDLPLTKDSASIYYMKVQSGFPLMVPITISAKSKFVENNQTHNIFWGIYMGLMIFAFLYNFFIYLSTRERIYLLYIVYVIGSTLFYLGLQGFDYQFIWPNTPHMNPLLPVIISITNIIILLFSMQFLRVSKEQKGQFWTGRIIMILFILIALIAFTGKYEIATGLAQMISLVESIFLIYIGISSWRRGIPTAKYFLLAWTLFLILVIMYIMTINNAIPSNFFTTHCIFIGHMTEVLLLSFALADRINWLKKENEDKQQQIIYQLEENEKIQLKANRELEQKVQERTAEVVEQRNEAVRQRERSDELLLNILPEETAEELKATGTANATLINHVTVLFTDMKDFTLLSEKLSPKELVAEINECFSEFDRIMDKYGVEKIKTIGDAYMAAGGLPTPNETHAEDVVNAALEIQDFMVKLEAKKKAEGRIPFQIRIGIHTGPVVAGIVGIKKFAYDIWGDTVNIASRMESSGEAGRINISGYTWELIKDKYNCTERGKIDAKNKGMIDMYFVDGKK